jgi:hypothetical protein
VDGVGQNRMTEIAQKNRRMGLLLTAVALSLFVYSYFVIRHRGNLTEPKNMTPLQKIWQGL